MSADGNEIEDGVTGTQSDQAEKQFSDSPKETRKNTAFKRENG